MSRCYTSAFQPSLVQPALASLLTPACTQALQSATTAITLPSVATQGMPDWHKGLVYLWELASCEALASYETFEY